MDDIEIYYESNASECDNNPVIVNTKERSGSITKSQSFGNSETGSTNNREVISGNSDLGNLASLSSGSETSAIDGSSNGATVNSGTNGAKAGGTRIASGKEESSIDASTFENGANFKSGKGNF